MDPRMYPGGVTVVEATVNPASINANVTGNTTVAVPGVKLGKSAVVFVNIPSTLDSGVSVAGVYVSADDQITLRLHNGTGSAVDVAASVFVFGVLKYKT